MDKLFKVIPKTDISGILPNNKRIQDTVIIPLNRKEYVKCTNFGDVYAIVGDKEVYVSGISYDDAMKLFDIKKPYVKPEIVIHEPEPVQVEQPKPIEEESKKIEPVEEKTDESIETEEEVLEESESVEESNTEEKEESETESKNNNSSEIKHTYNRNQKNQYQSSSKKNKNRSNNRR